MTMFIVEHKTTSEDCSAGSDYWKRLRIDGQISQYLVGARALDVEADEVLYDVVHKIGLRPSAVPLTDSDGVKIVRNADGERVRTKDGKKWRESGDTAQGFTLQTRPETAEEYRARVREEIAGNPAKYFVRGRIARLDADEADAAHDTWQTGRNIRESELTNRWPRNPDACVRYGRTCGYFAACTREASLDDPAKFRKGESPHEELGAAKLKLPLLTSSSMKTFRRCPREYQLSYVLWIRPVEDAESLRFGTLVHKGLEVWWQTVDLDKALDAVRQGAADEYERVRAEELMRGYHFRWKDEPLRVLHVEREFIAPLINPATGASSKTFALGGKIDAIACTSDDPAAGQEAAQ